MYHLLNTRLKKATCLSLLLLATQVSAHTEINITQEQYLSNVLNNIDTNNNYDYNAMTWLSVAEKQTQKNNKELLLQELTEYKNSETQWLINWLQSLPITGRVAIPVSDYKLMEANLDLNPYLMRGDVVKLLNKTNKINIIASNGKVCQLPFVAGKTAKSYTKACQLNVDSAYLINANGKVSKQEFGDWQNQDKKKITAGSTLWVPTGRHKPSDELNEKIADIIATQSIDFSLPTPLKNVGITTAEQQKILEQVEPTRPDMGSSYSDWGIVGLMQTPTARMQKAGEVALTVAKNDPYSLYTMTMQPTDNLEVGFRFTDIADRAYGAADDDGDKSLKDKSLSVKLKVLDESKWLPAVAIGMRDPLGTGLFDGEYIVANKRFKNVDASLGVGFGYLGNRKNISNPLGSVHSNYKTRKSDRADFGGEANYKNWFTGKGALFGGLLWQTPYNPLSVKVEYDGNDYSREPSAKGKLEAKSPINLGLQWQTDDVNVTVG
ncbi:MAG: YjbH domain-containing protein, partial [Moraxellaceae bacterium]|nr:YjbH domain-containing protein [Moraxellaceae bacterium]